MSDTVSFNLIELGHFSAYCALVMAVVQAFAPIAARVLRRPALASISVNASVAVFVLTTIGALTIIHAFVTSNFSVQYVAVNSNTQLPLFYKVSALWGGHEGSLYLWVWVLSFYTMLVAWHGIKRYPDRLPVILAVQGFLVIGFFGLILFLSNPFLRLFPVPPEGRDLNPLLQDPGMVIHPPMLYFGYVGFSVPFAFAMTALITRWKSEQWVGLIRRWALIAWGFLTTGIIIGSWWAYYELGWGGYWAWDPVENASFMPWLMGTALIHSITVQERRKMLHAWNIFLVITTFSLSLLGTFLVRSGVLSSVHAFAVDPGRGAYILGFMTVVLATSFGIFLARGRHQIPEEAVTDLLSRESLFVWNNVLFTVAASVVLLGTLYPLALEALTGGKITVGAPYFNAVMVPIFLATLALMAVGPLVPWRRADFERLKSRLALPGLAAIAAAVLMLVFARPTHWTAPVAVAIVMLAFSAIISDYARAVGIRRAQQPGETLPRLLARTLTGNRRHYGGMIVHVGVVIIACGLIGSGLFRQDKAVVLGAGDVVEIGSERIRFEGVRMVRRDNYEAMQGVLRRENGDLLTPERRRYPVQEMPTTESAIHSSLFRDLYVVLGEPIGEAATALSLARGPRLDPIGDVSTGRYAVHVYLFPLLPWLWFGGVVILAGLGLTLSFRVRRASAQVPAGSAVKGAAS